MKYTDLIFDLYGTLVDIHTDENDAVWEKTALYFGYYGAAYSPSELKAAFRSSMAAREAEAGQSYECFPDIPFEEVMCELFEAKNIKENALSLGINAAQLFRVCSTDYIKLYPHVREALEYLRSKGCRLWLLSNAQQVFTRFELRHLALDDLFDGIYISSLYGFRKPDRRYFQALIDEQNLDTGRCLMIGNDRNTDIAGAKALGIATLYMHTNITPPGQAKAEPTLSPAIAPEGCRDYEYEGSSWETLAELIEKL